MFCSTHQAASMALQVPAGCGMCATLLSESVHCCLSLTAQPLSLVSLSTQLLQPLLQLTPCILVCRDACRPAGQQCHPQYRATL